MYSTFGSYYDTEGVYIHIYIVQYNIDHIDMI